jgi:hypothetical protein
MTFVVVVAKGAIVDGPSDIQNLNTAFLSGASVVRVRGGTFDLQGGTLTLPAGVSVHLDGGLITNGTIACNNNYFSGARGLSSTITLTGSVANEDGVFFDWFACQKSTRPQYDTFINGNNQAFGAAPSINGVNRTILKMLIDNGHEVKFGSGIYPFDAEASITGTFCIKGASRGKTLLWAPTSNFLRYSIGGATYPQLRDLTIEANGSVIRTDAWTVNAIHGLVMERSFFVSYSSHTFHNDYSTAGGSGCPIYGTKVSDCAVFAGPGMGGFFGWNSGSNIFDNLVDHHLFFNGAGTRFKGTMKAIFFNSNVQKLVNSNVAYSAFEYVFYWDRPSSLVRFNAFDNVFETNNQSFQAVARIDSSSSNFYIAARGNQYIGAPTESYHYICNAGNAYVVEMDAPTPVYGSTLRNLSVSQEVRFVTGLLDNAGTRYRIGMMEPRGAFSGDSRAVLLPATAENAALIGMSSEYAANSANISFIAVTPSSFVRRSGAIAGGFGTTAARPTQLLYPGYPYFDTTLNRPIWWNGSGWRDSAGATV